MKYLNSAEVALLISLLVKNNDKKLELLAKVSDCISDNLAVMEILKNEGCITLGIQENDESATELEDMKTVDKIIYDYFNYLKNEWIKPSG